MKREKSIFAGAGAAFLAVLGSITCCGAPIAAGILASVGIGASQLQFLKEFQPYLIGIAIFSLLLGFYRLYFRKSNNCCGPQGKESNLSSNKTSKRFLWLITVFTLLMLGLSFKMNNPTTPNQTGPTTNSCTSGNCTPTKAKPKNSCCVFSSREIKEEKNFNSCSGSSCTKATSTPTQSPREK